eukprot:CAMPEP_0119136526 /NCGR_PEP_ID=MMETSP1310-20130426/21606_1 /TAXON_ID=464262 /ORGANISM="Genus nov. species nov., Strain RCC2339" /LENGTH=811 /DNA_ID=CAMNT_0007127523 /DNA_START=185 /DNA_END=2620 /DNA_ORIENTATION=-
MWCRAVLLLGVMVSAVACNLSLSGLLSSSMVLQRGTEANIWGWADPGATVEVSVSGGDNATAVADARGAWLVSLLPRSAQMGVTIVVSSDSGDTIQLDDVAFGDVYLCSGQSNMEMSVSQTGCYPASDMSCIERDEGLRVFTVTKNAQLQPVGDVTSQAPYEWAIAGPDTVEGDAWTYFSATCYFYGSHLRRSLLARDIDVPIGLVASCWGGTVIEAWSSPDALATCGTSSAAGAAATMRASAQDVDLTLARRTERSDTDPSTPSSLYNGMIHPLLHLKLSGALWYQGESNYLYPGLYQCQIQALFQDWREKFGQDFFVEVVQLAPLEGYDYQWLRQAQAAVQRLDGAVMVTAADLGDPTSPDGAIHPRSKDEIGRRLAHAAVRGLYGLLDVEHTGPTLESVGVSQVGKSTVVLNMTFSHASQLHVHGTSSCTTCCYENPFEVHLRNGIILKPVYIVHADEGVVELTFSTDVEFTVLTYAFDVYPECMLYNGAGGPDDHAGIPASPFTFSLPPPRWTTVCRQTYPFLYAAGEGRYGTDPDALNYCRLDELEAMRRDRQYEFLLRWPEESDVVMWAQTSNPTVSSQVEGYEPISVPYADFRGLALSMSKMCLLDGTADPNNFFYAVGTYRPWKLVPQEQAGLPGPSERMAQRQVELAVFNGVVWRTVYRQDQFHYFAPNEWVKNADTPDATTFAVLQDLEQYRQGDGKLYFRMYWPSSWNWWRQTSNPAVSTTVLQYFPVQVDHTDNYWGGLQGNNTLTLLEGSVSDDLWFYSVGSFTPYMDGIPAWNGPVPQVELYARGDPLQAVYHINSP